MNYSQHWFNLSSMFQLIQMGASLTNQPPAQWVQGGEGQEGRRREEAVSSPPSFSSALGKSLVAGLRRHQVSNSTGLI